MRQAMLDFQRCRHERMGVAVSPHETHTLFCPRCKHVWRRGVPIWKGALLARRFERMKGAKQ